MGVFMIELLVECELNVVDLKSSDHLWTLMEKPNLGCLVVLGDAVVLECEVSLNFKRIIIKLSPFPRSKPDEHIEAQQ